MTLAIPWTDSLIRLLEQQQAIVDRLSQLAESQAPLISGGRTDVLLDLLAQRQAAIDEFSRSQVLMNELTGELDQRLAGVALPQRERIKALISDIGARLTAVMKRDEQDQALLRADRDRVSRELASMSSGQSARHAYAGPSTHGARVADRTA